MEMINNETEIIVESIKDDDFDYIEKCINFIPTLMCPDPHFGGIWITGVSAEPEEFLKDLHDLQKKYSFDTIISISDDYEEDLSVFGFNHHVYSIEDGDNHVGKFKKILQDNISTIYNQLKNGDRILIHCQAGMNRSVTMILYYLIWELYHLKKEKITLIDHILNMRKLHPNTFMWPNEKFVRLLYEYNETGEHKIRRPKSMDKKTYERMTIQREHIIIFSICFVIVFLYSFCIV